MPKFAMRRLQAVALFTALCLLALAAATAAAAATVYRWVDDQGQVHYSEIVPERYQKTARPIDASAGQPTAEQQREALARAQQEKARAASAAASQDRLPTSAASAPRASQAAAKRPAQVPNAQTDCETWQRLYLESADCFGPYRTVRGGMKPEAFEVCNVVPEPPPRCRLHIP